MELSAVLIKKKMLKKSAVRIMEQASDWLKQTPSMEIIAKVNEAVAQLRIVFASYEETAFSEIELIDRLNKTPDAIDAEENVIILEVEKIRTYVINASGKLESLKSSLAEAKARTSLAPNPENTSLTGNQSFIANQIVSPVDRVKVPEFDGNVREFMNWKNLFEEIVHNNPQFNNSQRMYYLKGAMKKDAGLLLRDFEVSPDSYTEAWTYLLSRFENRRSIIKAHFNDLMSLPAIKNEGEIRGLLDKVNSIVRGLRVCGEKVDEMSSLISHIVASKLDNQTRRDWEHSVTEVSKYPSYARLETFLNNRSFSYEDSAPFKVEKIGVTQPSSFRKNFEKKKASLVNTTGSKCILCPESHAIVKCREFLAKNSHERFAIAKQRGLCVKCLCVGHFTSSCKGSNCSKCQKSHHDLLHHEFAHEKKQPVAEKTESASSSKTSLSAVSFPDTPVVLPTAVVRVRIGSRYVMARVLLDNCSQPNLVTESFVRKHNIPLNRSKGVFIDTIGNATNSNQTASLCLTSRFEVKELEIEADVVPRIPYSVPPSFVESMKIRFPDLKIAEHAIQRESVDIIIGGRNFHRLVHESREFSGELCAQKSSFGWIIAGPDNQRNPSPSSSCSFLTTYSIEDLLKEFWKIEEVTASSDDSFEHRSCEQHFLDNVSRRLDGKFCVKLPFKIARSKIGHSRDRAFAALRRIESQNSLEVRNQYIEFMREYEALGHMEKVDPLLPEPSEVYYIPHRAVIRPSSSTTKLRVVFNASSKSSTQISLNDTLMVGPTTQPELFDTLVRFRQHKIAFCADISKMYRCIDVHIDDQNMQRILWRESPSDPVVVYRLTTVTYGTAPASFLATKCLVLLADSISEQYPEASRSIRSDFYMDDLLTGAGSLDAAIELQKVVHNTLLSAQLPLRKYMSNSAELLQTLDSSLVEKLKPLEFNNGLSINVLGVQWDPVQDCFRVAVNLRDFSKTVALTKRLILSEIARIFDPLGFVSPVTIRAKIVLQDLWREQKGWDEPVSESISVKFREYYTELSNLSFSVPRCLSRFSSIVRRQLVGFCDASEKAYCAVLYLRTENELSEICTRLVCSKTRVAPIKELTIPRLELQAALLLAQLSNRVAAELNINYLDVFCFSDSSVVLCWLQGAADRWTVFVRNRVLKVRELCTNTWRYVSTKNNPADLGTRGASVTRLMNCDLWISGPSFLNEKASLDRNFPHEKITSLSETPEMRKEKCSLVAVCVDDYLFGVVNKFSCLDRLVNVFAYVLRFCRKNSVETSELVSLTAAERTSAFFAIVRVFQRNLFGKEIVLLENGSQIGKNSSIQSLSPFLDKDRVLRAGGRLKNSTFSFERKHPSILSARSFLVELLVRHVHMRYFHVSKSFILNYLNARFWIVGSLTNVIKRVINRCVACIRFKAQPMEQIMGQLPTSRVTVSRPFTHVGVDFAGPFSCKCINHRSTRFYKIYAAFFVCFVTRGTHIEIVKSLSTEDFLASLSRFASRRGVPTVVYSDNGTNFVGAKNLLLAQNAEILNYAAKEKFDWKFIPPRTPHQGGIWEAAVKSAKFHLIRVTKGTTLHYEEYATLFAKIESILNSRPLCYKSSPAHNGGVLTPSHFWLGSSLLSPDESTDCSFPDMSLPLTRRYELVSQQLNSFWSQWSREYLNQMQVRSKWRVVKSNVKIDDVVLLKNDLAPPSVWKFGIIVAVYPDKEGRVRMVDVRSSGIVKKRAVTSLVMLVPDEDSSARGVLLDVKSPSSFAV